MLFGGDAGGGGDDGDDDARVLRYFRVTDGHSPRVEIADIVDVATSQPVTARKRLEGAVCARAHETDGRALALLPDCTWLVGEPTAHPGARTRRVARAVRVPMGGKPARARDALWIPFSPSDFVVLAEENLFIFRAPVDANAVELVQEWPLPPAARGHGGALAWGAEGRGWERFSLFLAAEEGGLFVMCPFLPSFTTIFEAEWAALRNDRDDVGDADMVSWLDDAWVPVGGSDGALRQLTDSGSRPPSIQKIDLIPTASWASAGEAPEEADENGLSRNHSLVGLWVFPSTVHPKFPLLLLLRDDGALLLVTATETLAPSLEDAGRSPSSALHRSPVSELNGSCAGETLSALAVAPARSAFTREDLGGAAKRLTVVGSHGGPRRWRYAQRQLDARAAPWLVAGAALVPLAGCGTVSFAATSIVSDGFSFFVSCERPHGLSVGDAVAITSAEPAGYNGKAWVVADVSSATSFSVKSSLDLGRATKPGTVAVYQAYPSDARCLSESTIPVECDGSPPLLYSRAGFAGGAWGAGNDLAAGKDVDIGEACECASPRVHDVNCAAARRNVVSLPFFQGAGALRPNVVLLVSREGVHVVRVSSRGTTADARPASLVFRVTEIPPTFIENGGEKFLKNQDEEVVGVVVDDFALRPDADGLLQIRVYLSSGVPPHLVCDADGDDGGVFLNSPPTTRFVTASFLTTAPVVEPRRVRRDDTRKEDAFTRLPPFLNVIASLEKKFADTLTAFTEKLGLLDSGLQAHLVKHENAPGQPITDPVPPPPANSDLIDLEIARHYFDLMLVIDEISSATDVRFDILEKVRKDTEDSFQAKLERGQNANGPGVEARAFAFVRERFGSARRVLQSRLRLPDTRHVNSYAQGHGLDAGFAAMCGFSSALTGAHVVKAVVEPVVCADGRVIDAPHGYSFFAVFDATRGPAAAHFAAAELLKYVQRSESWAAAVDALKRGTHVVAPLGHAAGGQRQLQVASSDVGRVHSHASVGVDTEVAELMENAVWEGLCKLDEKLRGGADGKSVTRACACLVTPSHFIVGHVGTSRAIVIEHGRVTWQSGAEQTVDTTVDAKGGGAPPTVDATCSCLPAAPLLEALGVGIHALSSHCKLHHVHSYLRTRSSHESLVLACNGVWDVYSDSDVASLLSKVRPTPDAHCVYMLSFHHLRSFLHG